MLKIVPNAAEDEVDELFDSLDSDDGGELDVAELKVGSVLPTFRIR